MNNSNLKIPITAKPLIDLDILEQFWKDAKNKGSDEDPNVEFKTDGKAHILTVKKINEAFGTTIVENESYMDIADDATLTKFFRNIGCAGHILKENSTEWYPTGEMDRKYPRKEWNKLFDAIVKIFSTKTPGWNGIPSCIRKLTHSMGHGYKLNVGKMIMAQLRSAIIKMVPIYPRFITMFLNNVCGIVENAPYTKEWFVLKKNTHTSLINSDPHNDMMLHYIKHMSDQVSNLGASFTGSPVIFSLEDEAIVDPTQDNPHSSPYIPPMHSRLPKSLQKDKQFPRKEP